MHVTVTPDAPPPPPIPLRLDSDGRCSPADGHSHATDQKVQVAGGLPAERGGTRQRAGIPPIPLITSPIPLPVGLFAAFRDGAIAEHLLMANGANLNNVYNTP